MVAAAAAAAERPLCLDVGACGGRQGGLWTDPVPPALCGSPLGATGTCAVSPGAAVGAMESIRPQVQHLVGGSVLHPECGKCEKQLQQEEEQEGRRAGEELRRRPTEQRQSAWCDVRWVAWTAVPYDASYLVTWI